MATASAPRLLFIGFGDIQCSLGARAYLLSLIDVTRGLTSSVQVFFLQQRVTRPTEHQQEDPPVTILTPPGENCSRLLPGLLWRTYELAWANWRGLRLIADDRKRSTVCMIAGAGLLPLSRLLRRRYPTLMYIQHGIAEEFLMSGTFVGRLKYFMAKALERAFLPLFDVVITVSAEMGAYCSREYGVKTSVTVPCCVDLRMFQFNEPDRAEMRKALGLEDRVVFVYSGGAAQWQCLPETIRFYQLVRRAAPNAFFLVLSADVESWKRALRVLDPQDYAVLNVKHAVIGRYLGMADAAFLLRKNNLVNAVSAPVKFAEYLACGLAVATSPYVGDYSSMVLGHHIGVLIDPDDESTWHPAVRTLIGLATDPATRTRCLNVARSLAWETVAPRLRAALQTDTDRTPPARVPGATDEYVHK